MRGLTYNSAMIAAFLMCSLASTATNAATGVGKAIISIGKVTSTSQAGVEKKLKRRGKVFEGDTINVGGKSRLQLRFIDDQLVVLKENTIFRIDEYKFKDKDDDGKSAALSLLKGGMRSVTGLIGKSPRDKYKVKTPVATMGVRGTHYVVQICSGNCGDGITGIVGTVLQGAIVMTNDAGTEQFGTDQFFNVPSVNQAPTIITNPPAILISRDKTSTDKKAVKKIAQARARNNGRARRAFGPALLGMQTAFQSGEQQNVTTTAGAVSTSTFFIKPSPAPLNALLAVSGIIAETDGAGGAVGREGSNASIGIATVSGAGNQPVAGMITDNMGGATAFRISVGATVIEGGGNGTLGINWGRWANKDVAFKDNNTDKALLTGLAFVYSPNPTSPSAISSFSSTNTYNLAAGPSIRDETGALVSTVGNFGVTVDFSSSSILAYGGTLSGNGRSYVVSLGQAAPLFALFAGDNLQITSTCSGCPGGVTSLTGTAGLSFVGPSAEALIGYFGLNDTGGTIGVSGSGVYVPGTPPS